MCTNTEIVTFTFQENQESFISIVIEVAFLAVKYNLWDSRGTLHIPAILSISSNFTAVIFCVKTKLNSIKNYSFQFLSIA